MDNWSIYLSSCVLSIFAMMWKSLYLPQIIDLLSLSYCFQAGQISWRIACPSPLCPPKKDRERSVES